MISSPIPSASEAASALPLDDPQVYELMKSGNTVGVFQLESEGMRRTLSAVKPSNFGDIVDAPPALAAVVSTVGWIVPAFSIFDHKNAIVSGLPVDFGRVYYNLLYAAAYVTAAIAAAVAVFSRREFK